MRIGVVVVSIIVAMVFGAAIVGGMLFAPPQADATVTCLNAGRGVACTARRTAGDRSVEVCWTAQISCANREFPHVRRCVDLRSGAPLDVSLPASEFTGGSRCDRPIGVRVRDVKLHRR